MEDPDAQKNGNALLLANRYIFRDHINSNVNNLHLDSKYSILYAF